MIADLEFQSTRHDPVASAIRRWLDQGDERAAAWLVSHHRAYVKSIVRGWLPQWWMEEDVVQDVFSRVFAALPQFDAGRSFQAWLAAIARNTCAKVLRAAGRSPATVAATEVEIDADAATHLPAADEPVLRAERRRGIRCLLAALPRQDRRILILYRVCELPAEEVARQTGLSSGNVRLRALRAQNELRTRAAAMLQAGVI